MATQQPYALQNASHGAALFRQAVFSLVNSGGGSKGGVMNAADLVAAAQSTPNMSVQVSAGRVWVPGTQVSSIGSGWSTQAGYFGINDASVSVTIATANATNPRIDVIYVAVNDAFYSGSLNTMVIGVATGTPAASPVAPAIPNNALALANVAVAANATSIVSGNIAVAAGLLTVAVGGILPVTAADTASGARTGQYRDQATLGLQRWDGSSWKSQASQAYVDARVNLPSSGWTAVTYANGWVDELSHGPATRYRKLSNGQVEVQGSIKSGTIGSGTPAFTLPVGYRPGALLVTTQLGNDALARVDFRTDGSVAVIFGSTAVYTTVNFKFFAEG